MERILGMVRSEPQINIRLPQELKDKIIERAASNKRSVNAEVVAALEMVVRNEGQQILVMNPSDSDALKQIVEELKKVEKLEKTVNDLVGQTKGVIRLK